MSKRGKISNRTRERAALICAVSASTGAHGKSYEDIADDLDLRNKKAVDLALYAWFLVMKQTEFKWNRATDAEAEALLRTGWSP